MCMQVPTGFEFLSLVTLTLGVVLAIWEGSIAGSPSGIGMAVASTFCGAAMLNFSGKVSYNGGFSLHRLPSIMVQAFSKTGSKVGLLQQN